MIFRLSAALCCGFLTLLATAPAALGAVVRQPYLQLVTPTSVTVVWRTDTPPADSRVRYGTVQGNLNQTATSVAVTPGSNPGVLDHIVTISGLAPGTKYFYDVGTTSGGVQGGGTAQHYFVTAPPTGSATAFTAWILGDSGDGSTDQMDVRDAMLGETGSAPPDLMLHVGDIAYDDGTDSEFTDNHFAIYEDILRHTALWPSLGNHEAVSVDTAQGTGPYYEAHVLPAAGQAGGVASGTEAYYSFDYANVHFVVLDSMDSDSQPGSLMLQWLAADLAATAQDWIVAYWHHPPYSKSTHDSDDATDSGGRLVDMRENVLPVLEAGGVDLALSGHSHNYERSYLIDQVYGFGSAPDFATPSLEALVNGGFVLDMGDGDSAGDGAYQKVPGPSANDGVVYAVTGHGGRSVGGDGGHPVMFFQEAQFGSCLLDVDGDTLTLSNLRADGVITDQFSIVKQIPASLPTPPSNLTAIALTSTTVDLSFTDNSVDEMSFEIERSLSGVAGPFAPIAIIPANAISHTDTGIPQMTEACYRVRAVNALGPSSYSNIACDTTASFVAYNDVAWASGQLDVNVTTFTSPNGGSGLSTSGELLDFDTGSGTGVTLTVTGGTFNGTDHATISGTPAPGTDAHDVFDSKLTALGSISYQTLPSPAGDLVLDLSGLDPGQSYEIVFYGHRDDYGWDRASLVTIGSAEAFTNQSSAAADNPDPSSGGAIFSDPADDSTRLPADNDNGYVARFVDVASGVDGVVTLTVSWDGTPGPDTDRGKYANALMLRAGSAPTNAVTVDAVGMGTVNRNPDQPLYDIDDVVQLTAVPDAGWQFQAWSGDLTGMTNPDNLTVTGGMAVTATFVEISGLPAPTNLSATAVGTSQIDLGWTDNSVLETGFEIERSLAGMGGPFLPLVTVAADTTAFPDATLAPGTPACYRVRAIDALGTSDYSDIACDTTPAGPARVSAGLVAYYPLDEGSGSGALDQSGVAPAMDLTLTGNAVWNSGANGVVLSGGRIGTVGAATKVITALQASGQSSFEIFAAAANVSQSGPARMLSVGGDPSVQNFILGQIEDDVEVRLLHTGKASHDDPRLVTSNDFLTTAMTHMVHTYDGATERLYVNGVEHPTSVSAVGDYSNWDPSDLFNIGNEGSLDRPWDGTVYLVAVYDRALSFGEIQQNLAAGASPFPPAPPTNLSATAASASQIDLGWTDNAIDETSFEIERSLTGMGGPFLPLDAVGVDVTAYADGSLAADTNHCYQVRAVNAAGLSAYSNVACDTTGSIPSFVAYNDVAWASGQLDVNVTTFTSPNGGSGLSTSGELLDFDTGSGTGVTLTVTGGTFNGTDHATISGTPAPGTDAHDVFDSKLTALGSISYQTLPSPAGDLVLDLSGLDPGQSYEIVFYGHRDDYGWDRASLVTIGSADAFTNQSSAAADNPDPSSGGAIFSGPADDSTRLPADNDNGYVARFVDVASGVDGVVTLTVSWDGTPGPDTDRGKYANALMLRAGSAPTNAVTVDAVGMGTVNRNPDQPLYDIDDVVQLTAVPDAGWQFQAWSGDLTGMTNPDNLTVTGGMAVTATFVELPEPSAAVQLLAGVMGLLALCRLRSRA